MSPPATHNWRDILIPWDEMSDGEFMRRVSVLLLADPDPEDEPDEGPPIEMIRCRG